MRTQKEWFVRSLILSLSLAHAGSAGAATLPLSNIFTNTGAMSATNLWQYAASNHPTYYTSTTSGDYRFFRGVFTPASTNAKLAIHSDDGSTVVINGQTVLNKAGQATSLTNMASSFNFLNYTFSNGVEYCVEVTYQNGQYTPGDQDGVTLYAYDGGGSARGGLRITGNDAVCVGNTMTLTADCGTPSFSWSSGNTSVATVNSSGMVTGVSSGSAVITVTDAESLSGSKTIYVVKPGISPSNVVTGVGVTNTFVLTNSAGSGTVTWNPQGTLSPNTRTNKIAFASPGTTSMTASYAGCSANATITAVAVASLTADVGNICGSGQIIYTAQSNPAGYESMLTWSGEGLSGTGAKRTNVYSTLGPHVVSVSCGTSVKSVTNTVYKIDIAQTTETALADSTTPVVFYLTNSYGWASWHIGGAGPYFAGSDVGTNVSINPGSVGGNFPITATALGWPSCSDTATLQVVQVTYSTSSLTLCEGGTSNLTITVTPPSAASLLSFDTVTNIGFGPANTHASVSVNNGTNLTVTGLAAGTAWLRAKLGAGSVVGPTLQIVGVTFPPEPWYVGVGKTRDFAVTFSPSNAPVTFDTEQAGVVSVQAITGGVRVTGLGPGTNRIRARVGSGAACSSKEVVAVQAKFATNQLYLCNGNPATVGVSIQPAGSPVSFVSSNSSLQVTVQGTNVTVTMLTNGAGHVTAMVGGAEMDWLSVWGFTVRFPSNPWYAAPGGVQTFTVLVDPFEFAQFVGFMSSDTNIITLTGGCAPPCLTVRGITNGTAQIIAWAGTSNQTCSSKLVTVLTPAIASVQWVNLNGSAITNFNPNPGGGLMVFPDSPVPGALPANQVRVRATLSYPVNAPNAVYFHAYDVDDPSANAPPLDNEASATDNRGTMTPLLGTAFTTDTNGIAEAVFTLSMQPGDNFRVVAATDPNYFNGLVAAQNDGVNARVTNAAGVAVPSNLITPLLTVWRRLHVELDSMAAVTNNQVTGNITSIAGSATNATNLTLSVNLRTGLTPQDDSPNLSTTTYRGRFENGWIRIGSAAVQTSGIYGNGDTFVRNASGFNIPAEIVSGGITNNAGQVTGLSGNVFIITGDLGAASYAGSSFRVAGTGFTITANTAHTVTVNGTVQFPFVLHDDDDDTILPRNADTSDLARAFQPAYVEVRFDLTNRTPIAPFVQNIADGNPATRRAAYRFDNVTTEAAATFWTVYVLSAFQMETIDDNDPAATPTNGEGATFGIVDAMNGQGALVFLECLREFPPTAYLSEPYTVSHEIGHLFNGDHTDGGLMAQSSIRTDVNFTAVTLNRIRIILHP